MAVSLNAPSPTWKTWLVHQIKHRNQEQVQPFLRLIQTNNKLQEVNTQLQSQNVHLRVEVEKLKGDTGDNSRRHSSGGVNSYALEQKLYKLQEELTDMHKKRGENAQMIIQLNTFLQDKDKVIQQKNAIISATLAAVESLEKVKKELEMKVSELESANQMLKDEHQALQMAFTALEERYEKAQDQIVHLRERWKEQEEKITERLDAENADFLRAEQKSVMHDLEEAAKTLVEVDPDKGGTDECAAVLGMGSVVPTGVMLKFDAHDGEVYSVQWSSSGGLFASGGADRKIKLWRVYSGMCELKGTLVGSNAGITSLDFTKDDSLIVGASNDFALRVWMVENQRLQHTLTGHSGKVLSAKFLSENKVVSGSHDRTLKIWDLHSKSCMKTMLPGSSCNDLVTMYGTNVISGHFDKYVRFWDTRVHTDDRIKEILLNGRITSLCLAPDKSQLLCCTRDDSLSIIDLKMNRVSCILEAEGFKVGWDFSRAVFSPDVEYVAAGSAEGDLYIWNVSKRKVERILKQHNHTVMACSWNPTGSSIVSCEKGKTIVIWSDQR